MARVLIIEDDPQIARLIKIKLTNCGYDVTIAPDGLTGLVSIGEEKPDLVLLDVMLPLMNGHQVMQAIRQMPGCENLPVIMVSARGQEREIAEGLTDGAVDYIVKPFSTTEMVNRVRRMVG